MKVSVLVVKGLQVPDVLSLGRMCAIGVTLLRHC